MKAVAAALAHRTTVFFLMAALLVIGVSAYRTLPREAFPDIQIPLVLVYTLYPGASPDDIESQITDPIERELQGLEGLDTLTSTSQESVSLVTVEFVAGTDIDDALQKVRDRVDLAEADFPDEAEEPILQEINFSNIPVLQVNLAGDVGPVVLKRLAEDLRDELETVPGVLKVDLVGGREREVRVEVDPSRLRLYGLALSDVTDAIRDENVAIPGGELDLGEISYSVRVPGEVAEPEEIAEFVIVTRGGSPITVGDVAEVVYGFEDRASYARINGQESVALTIQKRQGENIVDVVERSRAMVAAAAAEWPSGVEVTFLGDLSLDVDRMVKDLENNILSGLTLVVIVLMFVLGLRNAFLVGLAIPFSMLVAFVILQGTGVTLNNVVLFSLVLAVGMLVDNAVVVIENIYRHVELGERRVDAALIGTREVAAAIIVSTATTVAAFAPLLFWPGIVGDFMYYMPLTVSIVLSASLLVGLTINPVMAATFLRSQRKGAARPAPPPAPTPIEEDRELAGHDEPEAPPRRLADRLDAFDKRLGAAISGGYERLLAWSLGHRLAVVGGTFAIFVAVVALFVTFNTGIEFFPETEPPQIMVDVEMPPGTRVERTNEVVAELERRLADTADLELMSAAAGAGAQADFFSGGGGDATGGRLTLDLWDREDREQSSFVTMEQVREAALGIPGATIEVSRPDEGPPVGAPLAIEIRGADFARLGEISQRVVELVEDIPGLVALDTDFDLARPELVVDVDRVQAARLGLTASDIAGTVRTAVTGTEASVYRQGTDDDEVDVRVRLAPEARRSLDDLAQLTIVTDDGAQVPLASIATLRRDASLTSIQHKNRARLVTVTGDVSRPELAEPVRREAERRIAAAGDLLPPGYTMTFAGQSEDEDEAKEFLSRAFLYAILLVLALMVGKFDSLAIPLIIISSVLMSMVGVLIGLLVTGLPFGIIMTGLGVISLAGIVVNNAIVLLDYGEQLWAQGLSRREVVMETGLRRLRPVLLTAVTTILGLIPLTTGIEFDFTSFAFSTGGESSQWWQGMGVAVIFGLAFATFLTLILVPVLYDGVLAYRERRQESAAPETGGAQAVPAEST